MHISFKPGILVWLLLILAIFMVWGNSIVFNRLTDISHKSAPMPQNTYFQKPSGATEGQIVVRVGVVSRFAPNIIFQLYQPIMDYLNTHSDNHHELVLSKSYQDAATSLQSGVVQASFLGAWMCYKLPPDSGLIPVVMPINAHGVSRFHAALVTAKDSPIHSLFDLKNQKVAVPSNQSFSGNWLQLSGLQSTGLAMSDVDTIQHFQHHETVIWQVLRGDFVAGVVKESLAQKYRSRGLRTVALSPYFPGPPLVVCSRNTSKAVNEMVQLLLALDHNNSHDRAVLDRWTPEFSYGFIPVGQNTYKEDFLQAIKREEVSP